MSEYKPVITGWHIRRIVAGELVNEAFKTSEGKFVDWMRGNLFNSERGAIAYAEEFGIQLGSEADVVRYEF